jgi:hypothetical protein
LDTPVRVALTTYEARRFGYLKGEVVTISPTSEVGENREAHFLVSLALSNQFVGTQEQPRYLRAGMEVSAEFVTESRSLLQYFAGPIQSAILRAFTERG